MGYHYLLSTKTYYSKYQSTKVVWPSGRTVGGPATPKQRECHRYKFGSQGEGTASPLLHTRSLRVRSRLHFSPESSLSRVFRGSSETEDRARLRFHRTLTGQPRTLSQTFGASDRRAQAGLEPRIGRRPCSPAAFPVVNPVEGTRVRGIHTTAAAARGTEGTTGGPHEDAARHEDDRRAWRNECPYRSSYPLPGPGRT